MIDAAASLGELGADQTRLITRAREYLRAAEARGLDMALHPDCYLTGWSNVRGNSRLQLLAGVRGARLRHAARRCKDALNVMRHRHLRTAGAELPAAGYDDLVVTWCRNGDFAADGEYRDRYFRTSSRVTPRTLWMALATDEHAVQRRDANVRVFHKQPGRARFSPLQLSTELLRRLSAPTAGGRLPWLSGTVTYAECLVAEVGAMLRAGSFRRVVVPYEAQPFQHAVFRVAKSVAPALRTVGYLHSALPPLPADLSFREGAPDELLVHGAGQVEILANQLGWPGDRLHMIPSLRYRSDDEASLAGFIFLPMDFSDPSSIVSEFRDFVAGAPPASLAPLVVRNHPVMRESRKHQQLERNLQAILAQYADRFSGAAGVEPLSVFIGATAAIVEALERGVAVIHICSQPLMEAHTADIWRGFSVERFGQCLFRYRLRVRGGYISFGSGSRLFDEYVRKGEMQ